MPSVSTVCILYKMERMIGSLRPETEGETFEMPFRSNLMAGLENKLGKEGS